MYYNDTDISTYMIPYAKWECTKAWYNILRQSVGNARFTCLWKTTPWKPLNILDWCCISWASIHQCEFQEICNMAYYSHSWFCLIECHWFNWAKLDLIWDGLITMYLVLLSLRATLLAQNTKIDFPIVYWQLKTIH